MYAAHYFVVVVVVKDATRYGRTRVVSDRVEYDDFGFIAIPRTISYVYRSVRVFFPALSRTIEINKRFLIFDIPFVLIRKRSHVRVNNAHPAGFSENFQNSEKKPSESRSTSYYYSIQITHGMTCLNFKSIHTCTCYSFDKFYPCKNKIWKRLEDNSFLVVL